MNVSDRGDTEVLDYRLLSTHPNPFNAGATVRFNLQQAGRVVLSAFDLAGREAARLIDANLSAGKHQVSWTPGRINSGVYLLRLATPSGVLTEQVVLMR